jgi:3-hydroxybutyryl-CoA dehydratase
MSETIVSAELHVDRATIGLYAELTADFNPIHLDPEFAARTPMGGIIAHGTLSMNLIVQALEAALGAGAARDLTLDVRFVKPVREGDTVQAHGRLLPGPGVVYEVWVENQDALHVIDGTATVAGVD